MLLGNAVWEEPAHARSCCSFVQQGLSNVICFSLFRLCCRNEEDNFIVWPGYSTKGDVWNEQLEAITVSQDE